MSLKAKIEAVIYASEEPVTLPQLVSLLGQEAQAELDAAEARQGQLALGDPALEAEAGDPDLLNAETLGSEDPEAMEAEAAISAAENDILSIREPLSEETSGLQPEISSPREPETPLDAAGNDVPLAETPAEAAPHPSETRARERRLRDYMRSVLDRLIADYAHSDRGLEIREIAGGFRFATKPEYHDAVRGFVRSLKPPLKLSLQALETLAVVAYKQPVTAPEVGEVRGVDSSGVLGSLMTRKLVTTAGRKQVIGRPILYKTTKEFLLRFGLKDLSELPSIEEFERLASDMNEAVQEEIQMPETNTERPSNEAVEDVAIAGRSMGGQHEAQADGIPDQQSDAEHLTPAADGPGEFTGNESAPPADNASIDGRISGVPPNYNPPGDETADSPANDAAVQAGTEKSEQLGNAGSDD